MGFSIEPQLNSLPASDGYQLNTYELKLKTGMFSPTPTPKGYFFYIQGSGYQTVLNALPKLASASALGFRVIFMERRGIDQNGNVNIDEAQSFASKQQRINDHLDVIRHYLNQGSEPSQNVFVMGASEGGDVAAAIAEKEKRITHLIMLGSGGGWTQAREIEFFIKSNGTYLGLNSVEELEAKLKDIQSHPNSSTLWAGHPYLRWSSFLFSRNIDSILKAAIPSILFQGDQDESVPVQSAREAQRICDSSGTCHLTYREIANASHGFMDQDGKSLHPYLEVGLIAWLEAQQVVTAEEANEFTKRVKKAHPDLFPKH